MARGQLCLHAVWWYEPEIWRGADIIWNQFVFLGKPLNVFCSHGMPCSNTELVNWTSILSIQHFPKGNIPSMKPMCPPLLTTAKMRLGFLCASLTGRAGEGEGEGWC